MGNNNAKIQLRTDLWKYVCLYRKYIDFITQTKFDIAKHVKIYVKNFQHIANNIDIMGFIHCVHKLHPQIYNETIFGSTREQDKALIKLLKKSIVNQIDFSNKIKPIIQEQFNYSSWKKQYKKFLLMCRNNPNSVIVPTMIEDFMWHAHMLDSINYSDACYRIFGKLLYHNDTINDEMMEKYKNETKIIRNPQKTITHFEKTTSSIRNYNNSNSNSNYNSSSSSNYSIFTDPVMLSVITTSIIDCNGSSSNCCT